MRYPLLSLFLLSGSAAAAQVVLTDANSSPQPGDAYVREQGIYLDPEPITGGTTVYDYSGLSSVQVDTLRFTPSNGSAWYSGLVPGAEAELYYGSTTPDGEVIYYSGTNIGLDVIGVLDAGTLAMSDTKTVLVYPCTTGSSWTDTYYGYDASTTASKGGTISVTVGGQCDVITPAGTFHDVLRLDVVESLDYTYLGGFVLHRDITIAVYRAPGIHHPVMYCITSTGTDEAGNPLPGMYGEQCQWLQGDLITRTQAVGRAVPGWSLVQNPVTDLLRVAGTVHGGAMNYGIRAAHGGLVREGAASDLRSGVVVDGLPSGIYLLQCGGAAVRFVKE